MANAKATVWAGPFCVALDEPEEAIEASAPPPKKRAPVAPVR